MTEANSPHNLSDIIGEIDDLVQKHKQKKNDSFSDYTDSEHVSIANETPKTIQISPNSNKENQKKNDKGHYRGIRCGIPQNQDCISVSESNTTENIQNKVTTIKYIKMLEENNEVLKRSNDIIAKTIKEKDEEINREKHLKGIEDYMERNIQLAPAYKLLEEDLIKMFEFMIKEK